MEIMQKEFYSRTGEQTLADMQTSLQGLSEAEAAERLRRYGANALAEERRRSIVEVFFSQFKDLLVVILIAAAVISMLSGNVESTIVIFAVRCSTARPRSRCRASKPCPRRRQR